MTATTSDQPDAKPAERRAARDKRLSGAFPAVSWGEPRLWFALVIVGLFAALTAGVFNHADTFDQAFALWDGVAVITAGLVGGLLGVSLTYTRVGDAKQRESEQAMRNEQLSRVLMQSQAYASRVRESLTQLATLTVSFAEQRRLDPSKHLIGTAMSRVPAESGLTEDDVVEVDPYLQMLATQAHDILKRFSADAAPSRADGGQARRG